jgi:hypothetical protein
MRIKKAFLSVAALAAIIAFVLGGSAASAGAPTIGGVVEDSDFDVLAPDVRVHFYGRVDAVSDRGILMTTRRGEVRVLVGERTTIMVMNDSECVEGTLRGLVVGRLAEVAGVTTREPRVIAAYGIRQCRRADADVSE